MRYPISWLPSAVVARSRNLAFLFFDMTIQQNVWVKSCGTNRHALQPLTLASADRRGDPGKVPLALLQLLLNVLDKVFFRWTVEAQVPLSTEEPEERGPFKCKLQWVGIQTYMK